MEKGKKLITLGVALILAGMFASAASLSSQAYAQGVPVDNEKLKEILNATRTAIEANDIPGALTQLDMAEEMLSGGGNMTTTNSNTTTITA